MRPQCLRNPTTGTPLAPAARRFIARHCAASALAGGSTEPRFAAHVWRMQRGLLEAATELEAASQELRLPAAAPPPRCDWRYIITSTADALSCE
jgi:hypothetical protein